ncbi:hypothetical protein [Homoserinibacter sp. GY 40078]|uniref:hypothetical protein n=1 Tax=Homoserinibacter sp. GY 40078 TaxID=2603275 RepID=UPI0011CB3BEC|nr:hypothetical protein [Homoserinibacter sp. GY 40078]TXK18509.1 hypothetical protein FVQ89_00675 [Homoserinibacter sp. GY 40078]
MRSAPRAFAVVMLAGALVLPAAGAATASEGSVPAEVRAYVKGGGLADRLEDIYGEGADGEGIPFDDTTTPGPISRVFHWTDERVAGDLSGPATRLVNEWAVPVSLGEEPVGVAIVWINTETDVAELAEFEPDADAAVALADVPEESRLVRDLGAGAWFALEDDVLTPLVAGSSGVTGPTPVDEVALISPDAEAPPEPEDPTAAFIVAIGAVVVLLAIVVVSLLLPGRTRRTPDADRTDAL